MCKNGKHHDSKTSDGTLRESGIQTVWGWLHAVGGLNFRFSYATEHVACHSVTEPAFHISIVALEGQYMLTSSCWERRLCSPDVKRALIWSSNMKSNRGIIIKIGYIFKRALHSLFRYEVDNLIRRRMIRLRLGETKYFACLSEHEVNNIKFKETLY